MHNKFEERSRPIKMHLRPQTQDQKQLKCETHNCRDPKTRSIGVHASNNENSDSENDDSPLRASKMKDFRHPARPFFQNESDVDVTLHSNKESE